ncbi:hypothetical protein K440DRAFT_688612 [Wilcoxina mikolae CBS 423.85]|nr:hypothetical protein K440DRAFT_688612 [Wilcoxina mikolae CBS 423.85]
MSTNIPLLPIVQPPTPPPAVSSNIPTTVLSADCMDKIVRVLEHSDSHGHLEPYFSWLEYQFQSWNPTGDPNAVGEMFCDVVLHFRTDVNSNIIDFINTSNNQDRLRSIIPVSFWLNETTNIQTVARFLRLWMMLDPEDGKQIPKAWKTQSGRFYSGQFTVKEFVKAHEIDVLANPTPDPPSNRISRPLLKAKNLQGIAGIKFVWTFDITKHLYLEKAYGELYLFCMPCYLELEPPAEPSDESALESFGFPRPWRSEIWDSYGMIFGFSSTSGKNIFKKSIRTLKSNKAFDSLVLPECSIGNNAGSSESWEQEKYRYHWERIQILNDYLQEKRSRRSLGQLLRDKSDTYGYWTIWHSDVSGVLDFCCNRNYSGRKIIPNIWADRSRNCRI